MELKIKDEHLKGKVAFAGSNTKGTLGEKSQEELARLAIHAQESGDETLLNLFEGELPSVKDLKASFTKKASDKLTNDQDATKKGAASKNENPAGSNTTNTGTGNAGGTTGNTPR